MDSDDGVKLAGWLLLALAMSGIYAAFRNESWLGVIKQAINPKGSGPSPVYVPAANTSGNENAPGVDQGTPTTPGDPHSVAVSFGRSKLGDKYVFGAAGPNAYDCSGLTMEEMHAAGYSMPHNANLQMIQTKKYRLPLTTSPPAGTLCFFGTPGFAEHCGLSIGGGNMIVAPHTGDVVKIESIASLGDLIMVTDPLSSVAGKAIPKTGSGRKVAG